LEEYRFFIDQIFQVLYFSLGTVLLIVFSLVGYNWYTNEKIRKQDKESLKSELLLEFDNKIRKLIEQEVSNQLGGLEHDIEYLADSVCDERNEKLIKELKNSKNDDDKFNIGIKILGNSREILLDYHHVDYSDALDEILRLLQNGYKPSGSDIYFWEYNLERNEQVNKMYSSIIKKISSILLS
jgi:hypothetical protein